MKVDTNVSVQELGDGLSDATTHGQTVHTDCIKRTDGNLVGLYTRNSIVLHTEAITLSSKVPTHNGTVGATATESATRLHVNHAYRHQQYQRPRQDEPYASHSLSSCMLPRQSRSSSQHPRTSP